MDRSAVYGLLATIVLLATVGATWLHSRSRASRDFESLMRGESKVSITKVEINGYHKGIPVRVAFTNEEDVDFLSSVFHDAVKNEAGAFVSFRAEISFNDGYKLDALLLVPDDMSCIVVADDTSFLKDPVEYRLSLPARVPADLTRGFNFIMYGGNE